MLLAGGLAALAGATDIYGLGALHGLYVSFMSGNTTMLGASLGSGDGSRAAAIAGLIGLFVVGVALGAAVGEFAGRLQPTLVTLAVAALLALPVVEPRATAASLLLAMGALNASMNRVGDVGVSLTFVTGALVKIGQGVGKALCGNIADRAWLWQVPMWMSLVTGAVAATWLRERIGIDALWPLPAAACVLALLSLVIGPSRHDDGA